MSWLSRLFGGAERGDAPGRAEGPAEDYEGFRIVPCPEAVGGQYRIVATIEKDVGGEVRQHRLIRADTLQTFEEACAASDAKARQMIDEQGERLFD